MTQKTASAFDLHADHRHWISEIEMWQEDLVNWRSEHAIATDLLIQAKEMIVSQESNLAKHEERLREVRDAVDSHERTLSQSMREGADSETDETSIACHEQKRDTMASQREAHERIKKHHHQSMAKVEVLMQALQAPL